MILQTKQVLRTQSLVYFLAKYLPGINHLQKHGAQGWNGEQLERQGSQSVGSLCGQRGREHNPVERSLNLVSSNID